jgi:hypothetical protein
VRVAGGAPPRAALGWEGKAKASEVMNLLGPPEAATLRALFPARPHHSTADCTRSLLLSADFASLHMHAGPPLEAAVIFRATSGAGDGRRRSTTSTVYSASAPCGGLTASISFPRGRADSSPETGKQRSINFGGDQERAEVRLAQDIGGLPSFEPHADAALIYVIRKD